MSETVIPTWPRLLGFSLLKEILPSAAGAGLLAPPYLGSGRAVDQRLARARGERGLHPAPAPDVALREAGRDRGCPVRGAFAPGHWPRLERGRVRGAGRGLPQPRRADRRADGGPAPAVDGAGDRLYRALAPHRPRRHQAAARAKADPAVDGRR